MVQITPVLTPCNLLWIFKCCVYVNRPKTLEELNRAKIRGQNLLT